MTNIKEFAEDKINVAQMMISVFDRVESIVGKGENPGYQHILLFPPQCFQTASFFESRDCVVKSKSFSSFSKCFLASVDWLNEWCLNCFQHYLSYFNWLVKM